MRIAKLHSWDLTPKDAVALQRELAGRVDASVSLTDCRLVAGADVSYERFGNRFYAGVVVIRLPELEVVEKASAVADSPFPYVPGLLSFREAPVLLEAFRKLKAEPDVVMFDGQGYAHPRRFGLACHVGLWLERPCLGCAKTRLIGTHREPGQRAGSLAPLLDNKEVIGSVLRTKNGIKPLYISVGHRIDLPGAVRAVLDSCGKYRLPEPTRQAHLHVNALRRGDAC
ncbi:MAG: deoxyribonuclease V [Gemmataceae bacterium]